MKWSDSIRRTERNPGRSAARWKPSPLFSLLQETARLGPGLNVSGPGSSFALGPAKVWCTLPDIVSDIVLNRVPERVHHPVASRRAFPAYIIPLERKFCLGTTRSNSEEEFP